MMGSPNGLFVCRHFWHTGAHNEPHTHRITFFAGKVAKGYVEVGDCITIPGQHKAEMVHAIATGLTETALKAEESEQEIVLVCRGIIQLSVKPPFNIRLTGRWAEGWDEAVKESKKFIELYEKTKNWSERDWKPCRLCNSSGVISIPPFILGSPPTYLRCWCRNPIVVFLRKYF